MRKLILTVVMVLAAAALFADPVLNREDSWYNVSLSYENGFIKVLSHKLQFGDPGTLFDYVTQGGQEILFPFERFTADLEIFRRHRVTLLYQPLTIETQTKLEAPITIDGTLFDPAAPGARYESLDLKYGFPFWRVSYLYFPIKRDNAWLGLGLSLQLRNASIVFAASDGTALTVSQNLGPVPILKLRGGYLFSGGLFLETEVDGFYASSKFFNGADFEFEGSILDANLRAGFALRDYLDIFANLRFLGGTATGTSQYDKDYWTDGVEKYSNNRLATLTFTLGATLR